MLKINSNLKKYQQELIKWGLLLLYISIFYLILPVSLAIFIAYLSYPLFRLLNRYCKFPSWLAAIITEIILILSICFVILMAFQSILTLLPSININIKNFSVTESYHSFFISILQEKSVAIFNYFVTLLSNIVQSTFQYVMEFFVFAVALFFALLESRKSRTWFFIYVPPTYREEWRGYFTKGMRLLSYFLYVEFQLVVLTFLLLSGGFWVLGFQNAVIKAFLISLADSLPFFGIGIFLVPLSIYFYMLGDTFLCGVILLLYVFVQLTRQLAESMLWSSTLHLRAIHTFFISAASILLFGFYGILLSPVLLFLAVRLKDKANQL